MDDVKAQEIAVHLVPRSSDGDDDYVRYALNAVLFDQLADDEEPVPWLPADRQLPVAHWVQGSYLFTASASMQDESGNPRVELKSERLSEKWTVELVVRMSTDNPMGHAILENGWVFRSPEGASIEVGGKVVIRDPQTHGAPDDDEKFARLLAARIGWPAAA
jgi:hypothetical protein